MLVQEWPETREKTCGTLVQYLRVTVHQQHDAAAFAQEMGLSLIALQAAEHGIVDEEIFPSAVRARLVARLATREWPQQELAIMVEGIVGAQVPTALIQRVPTPGPVVPVTVPQRQRRQVAWSASVPA